MVQRCYTSSVCETATVYECALKAHQLILYFIGHLLGLFHEQSRPDRDMHVIYNCNNVLPPNCCSPGGPCCGWGCAFSIDPGHYMGTSPPDSEYDVDSIMHYRSWDFSNSKGPTLTDLNGNILPNALTSLSPRDIFRIRELYSCPAVSPPKCNKACSTEVGKCSISTAQGCNPPVPGNPNARLACACRAGYKATKPGIADGDVSKQWRLPAPEGNFRVWVAEGVECDTLCTVPFGAFSCQEVTELPAECLHT